MESALTMPDVASLYEAAGIPPGTPLAAAVDKITALVAENQRVRATAAPQAADRPDETTAAATWHRASRQLAEVEGELRRLLESAEQTGQYGVADDFRNYPYAEATQAALDAARQLLTMLGYGNSDPGPAPETTP